MSRARFVIAALLLAVPAAAEAAEICGNAVDDDADGFTDEGCFVASNVCESPLSCNDTGMVSPAMGALQYSVPPDVSPRVPWGPSIGLRRFYLSMYAPGAAAPAYRKPLGERWGHTYMTWLDKTGAPPSSKVVLHTTYGKDILATYSGTAGGFDNYNTFQAGFHAMHLRQRTSAPNEFQLKLLTGETIVYNSAGKLIEIWDSLAVPNKVLVAYDAAGQVSTVTDASGKRRLLFGYTGSVLTSVAFQLSLSAVWTTQHTTSYAYTTGNLTSVTIGGQLASVHTYASNYLAQIQDGAGSVLAAFAYNATTPGKIHQIDTNHGVLGYDYNSARTTCTGKTVLYFNRDKTTGCNVDDDCGTGFLCGGKTGTGATGACFRGARCLTVASPHEDLVTEVTALGPPGEPCEGACLDAAQYAWNTTAGKLDLTAIKDAATPGSYRARELDGNGMPTRITFGDPDADPTNGNALREVFYRYDNPSFPGRVTQIRRESELIIGAACSATAGACATTTNTYNADGKLTQVVRAGGTLDIANAVTTFSYTTTFSYNARGQVLQIDGPLAGSDDLTVFEYWSSSDPLKDGFLQHYKRKKNASTFLVDQTMTFDPLGNPTAMKDNNDVVTCATFDPARGYLSQRRQTMAGQPDCTTVNAADLTTSWTRDSALRLTKETRPDGGCTIYEYDPRGRLARTRRRDDCLAASSGDREEYTYSDDSLLTKIETFNAAGAATQRRAMAYYDSRRLAKLINPIDTSKFTGLTYDARGLLGEVAGGGNLNKTQWTYTADARVATEKRYTAGTSFDLWNLLYDWVGNQASLTDSMTMETRSMRDDLGRVVRIESPDLGGGPTLQVFDAASQLVTVKQAFGSIGQTPHAFTFDVAGRPLVDDHDRFCMNSLGARIHNSDVRRTYDAPPVACPIPGGCNRTTGRLAHVSVTLMCFNFTDLFLDQETFYSYDDAGRLVREYIRDDTGRVADHIYTWTKAGRLAQVTTPSTAVIVWTYGSPANNSDTDLITGVFRTTTATPVIDNVQWFPYGPLKQYNQQNTASGIPLRTRITRNTAYRITSINDNEPQTTGAGAHSIAITEDLDGRVIQRDYTPSDPSIPGLKDSFFLYDLQDRVVCETTSFVASCPTSGTTIKNSHSLSPPFTAAGDWKRVLRPIPGSTGTTNNFSTTPATHQIASVAQPSGTPALGTTSIGYDVNGNRSFDDNASMSFDRRDYGYDGRGNLTSVAGKYLTGGAWHDYYLSSAFDANDRRVFKSLYDGTTFKQATWFFYYDALDRLTEIRYTPDTAVPATYSVFQLFWLGNRLVLYWQTDYPSVTTSKRYVGTDETGRPIDMICWASPGNCPRVWSIHPSAWGFDTNLIGATVFQPILFAGQYADAETASFHDDGATVHRPAIALNGARTYDPFTGSYLQVDPEVDETWAAYVYALGNPVGNSDRWGEKTDDNGWCWVWSSKDGFESNDNAPASCYGTLGGDGVLGGGGSAGGGGGTSGGGASGGPRKKEPREDWEPRRPPRPKPKPEKEKEKLPDIEPEKLWDDLNPIDCGACTAGCDVMRHLQREVCVFKKGCFIDGFPDPAQPKCVDECIKMAQTIDGICRDECVDFKKCTPGMMLP